jgi:outer membrane lipoprotein-sorting protein
VPPTPRAPIDAEARRVVELLAARWQEFRDLRALADIDLKKGSDRRRLSGALLARAPASVRFEALSPFGQPFLLVTMHDGRIIAYNAATNEATVGPANVETAADLLSLPVEPEDLVALLSGRAAPPKDLRVAEILAPDRLGPSIKLVGRYNQQRVWLDFETGIARQVTITGGRTEATVTFQRSGDGALTGFDLAAGNDYVTGAVRYRSLMLNAGVDTERFALTLPKDAKINSIR